MNKDKKMDAATMKSYLHRKGYRVTPQRMAVLDAIMRNENKHLSASEIQAAVQKQYPGLGIATVYRSLHMLEREGLVNKFELDNTGHYEVNMEDDHCHLFCLGCGSISETEEEFVQNIYDLIQKKSGFTVQKRAIVFYGYCNSCLALAKKDGRKDID